MPQQLKTNCCYLMQLLLLIWLPILLILLLILTLLLLLLVLSLKFAITAPGAATGAAGGLVDKGTAGMNVKMLVVMVLQGASAKHKSSDASGSLPVATAS